MSDLAAELSPFQEKSSGSDTTVESPLPTVKRRSVVPLPNFTVSTHTLYVSCVASSGTRFGLYTLSCTSSEPPVRPRPLIFTFFSDTTGPRQAPIPRLAHAVPASVTAASATTTDLRIVPSRRVLTLLRVAARVPARFPALPQLRPPCQPLRDLLL